MKLLVINGPNLNMLGKREASIYGNQTYGDLISSILDYGKCQSVEIECYQSNHEGELIDKIQSSADVSGIIINVGAYTHTSVAIRDALLSVSVPFIEVHISNVYKRESFRHKSYLSDVAVGVVAGLGINGYFCAIDYFLNN